MKHAGSQEPQTHFSIGIVLGDTVRGTLADIFMRPDFAASFPDVRVAGAVGTGDTARLLREAGIPVHDTPEALLAAVPGLHCVINQNDDPAMQDTLDRLAPPRTTVIAPDCATPLHDWIVSEVLCPACKTHLAYTRNLFRVLVDEVHEDMVLLDTDGRIVDMNRHVLDRKGGEKEHYLGLHCSELDGGHNCCEPSNTHCPIRAVQQTHRRAETTHSMVDEHGHVRYLHITAFPVFDQDGAFRNIILIRRDTTQRTQMELRLQQSEKLAAIGELATYIAHEIRNPLFAIGGFANSLLRVPNLPDEAREKVRIILEEARRLDKILKSTLNFARPTEAREGNLDINDVITRTTDLLALGCRQQGVDLRVHADPGLPLIEGDPELLKQVLINLVKNAQEATPEGGSITVSTALAHERVVVNVADTGRGIPAELMDKVFNPFFSTKDQGAGLGLAMTRKIITDMGGDVTLDSTQDKGTTVTVTLLPVLAVPDKDE
ncbi:MAG: nitrogen regulation protein NR(II) [Desulfovibrionaceae bacterium]